MDEESDIDIIVGENFPVELEAVIAEGKITVTDVSVITAIRNKPFQALSLYPNPASDRISLVLNDQLSPGSYRIRLTDITGKVKFFQDFERPSFVNNQMTLDISNLENGIYIISLYNLKDFNSAVQSIRLLVNR